MDLLQRKLNNLTFTRIQRGSDIFQGGSNFFQGGGGGPTSNFYRNPYHLCFSRGVGPDPHFPFWIRTCYVRV